MIFKKNELKLLSPFYIFYLILGLSGMIFPFLIIYFRDLNFSFFQISAILACYSTSMFLFEIPTGALADSFSRKYSVILGFIISGLTIISISFVSQFWIILILFVIIGIGTTLVSGAEESWVIDNLNHYDREDLHREYFIKSQSIYAFAGIISPLIGAFIVKMYDIKPLWYIWGSGFLIVSLYLLIFANEKYIPKKKNFYETIKDTVNNTREGIKFSKTHNITKYIVLASIFMSMMLLDQDYWQPFLTDLNMPVYLLGIIFSVISAITMIIPFSVRYLDKYKVKNILILMISIRIIILSLVLLLSPGLFIIGAGFYIFSESLVSLKNPILGPYFQKHLPSKIRATITSVKSMGTQLGYVIGGLFMGYFADKVGVQYMIPFTGIFSLAAIYYLFKIKD